jgi:hypothetical protein
MRKMHNNLYKYFGKVMLEMLYSNVVLILMKILCIFLMRKLRVRGAHSSCSISVTKQNANSYLSDLMAKLYHLMAYDNYSP